MNTEMIDRVLAKTVAHYDEAYYAGHYDHILSDELNYRLLSLYWRDLLFARNKLDPEGQVLDFGCGPGHVSAALPNSMCFDFSPAAVCELRKRGRRVVDHREDIPRGAFDYLLSSHSLEHSPTPYEDLQVFREYLKSTGRLVLVLPVETNWRPTLHPDSNQHI